MRIQGSLKDHSSNSRASQPGSPGPRVSERHLKLTDKRLCEQRRNLLKLLGIGRQIGSQCFSRDSGSVVVGGVTTTQGVRESRTQGKGTYRPTVPKKQTPRATLCCIME